MRRVRHAERLGTGRDGVRRGRKWSACSSPWRLWEVCSCSWCTDDRAKAIRERLAGKQRDMPKTRGINVTFKRAPKAKVEVGVKSVSVWDAAAGSDAVDIDDE